MSDVKVHRVRYRLATKLREGAKISVATAQQSAQDRVKALEPKLLAAIEAEFTQLDEGCRALQDGDANGVGTLYDTGNRILGLAGAAPRLKALGTAALSLCDLLDGLGGALPDDLRPITVHIDTLRVLRTEMLERDQLIVLGGLTKLRGYYGRKAAAAEG